MQNYLNGVTDGSSCAQTGGVTYNTKPVVIGRESEAAGADYDFEGVIDELAIWNRSLSADEILDIYNAGKLELNLSVHSCDDATCDGEENIWDETCTNSPCIISDTVSNAQYFQYKANFNTEDVSYSPELYNVSIYNLDNVIDYNIT